MSLAIFGLGLGMQMFGQYSANRAQAKAERENALWMREQAAFMREAAKREEGLFKEQLKQTLSKQPASFASRGIEMAGSALDFIENTYRQGEEELTAIRAQSDMQIRGALKQADAGLTRSRNLKSFSNNFMQSGGTLLTGVAQYKTASGGE